MPAWAPHQPGPPEASGKRKRSPGWGSSTPSGTTLKCWPSSPSQRKNAAVLAAPATAWGPVRVSGPPVLQGHCQHHPAAGLPPIPGVLGTAWVSMNGKPSEKGPSPLGAEHPRVLRKRLGVQGLSLLSRGQTGGAGCSGASDTYLPGAAHLEGQMPSVSPVTLGRWDPGHQCHGAAPPWTTATPLPEVPETPKPVAPRSPASAGAGETAHPGLAGSAPGRSPGEEEGQSEPGTRPQLAPIPC